MLRCVGKSFYVVSNSPLLTAIINFITVESDNINYFYVCSEQYVQLQLHIYRMF